MIRKGGRIRYEEYSIEAKIYDCRLYFCLTKLFARVNYYASRVNHILVFGIKVEFHLQNKLKKQYEHSLLDIHK